MLSAVYADWCPPHLNLVVCYIFHLLIPLLCKTWFYKDWNTNCKNRCNKNTWHVESSYILKLPKYLLPLVNRFRYIDNNVTTDRCSIHMDTTARLGPLKFSLRATIDHHGPSMHFGHYTASIYCCKKNILLQRSHYYRVWNYWQQNLLYCICYTIWIGWHMMFGLEQEGGSLIAPMPLAHPLHPIDYRSKNRRQNLWVLLYEFCFLWFTNCVSDNSLIPGLVTFGICFK